MKIARINLQLGVTRADLYEKAEELTPDIKAVGIDVDFAKGTAHRYFVREMSLKDSAAYVERITNLVKRGHREGASVVVLPAISIVVRKSGPTLEDYAAKIPKGTTVVAGIYEAASLGHKTDSREGSVVLSHAGIDGAFPTDHKRMAVHAGKLRGHHSVIAVSSTVRSIREKDQADLFPGDDGRLSSLVIIDLGHEQYSGRYTRTLKSVHRHLKEEWRVARPFVVLAQWRYAGYAGECGWTVPDKIAHSVNERDDDAAAGSPRDELDVIEIPEK